MRRDSDVMQALSLAGVPVLVAAPARAAAGTPLRTVLWCHGFRADSTAHGAELTRLADAGWLAVGIDAVGHGRRAATDLDERMAADGALSVMLALADETVGELPALIDTLVADCGADRSHVSLVGISMGAFLAYRALSRGVRLRATVALLGSPEWPGDDSPHTAVAAIRHTSLLSIIAEHDERVSPEGARRLHAGLTTWYGDGATHGCLELRGSGHLTSAVHWHHAMEETVAWLERWG